MLLQIGMTPAASLSDSPSTQHHSLPRGKNTTENVKEFPMVTYDLSTSS